MRKRLILFFFALVLPLSAMAVDAQECVGRDLIAALRPEQKAELDRAVAAIPFNRGTLFEARKGDARILLIGTYHFSDPRHAATIARFSDDLDSADALLVEAGPEEQARLSNELATNPALIADTDGATLPERMAPEDWARLSAAMTERGVPAFVASRMRPWYVAMMLGISPCMLDQVKASGKVEGLDHLLLERAEAEGVPVVALEPWDTVFTLFAGMTPEEEIEMLQSALPAADHADDYASTLINAFFSGKVWDIWEFGRIDAYENSGLSREDVDHQIGLAQEKMMDQRNESWIAPLVGAADAAAKDKGHVVAAFGALHLPGERGVLRLLEREGFVVSALGPTGDAP
ncbi:TraB/GumN family protein [Paracoccus cavernae]|uniref:TraB/GumN family protein n=1 Tax=Paracoccus cavernae TaxID=1571207 RepID=UPI0035F26DFC